MRRRERWIIYPLLIFALGLGLRPLFYTPPPEFQNLKCGHLTCSEVTVVGVTSEKAIAKLGPTSEERPELVLYGIDQQPQVRLQVEAKGQGGVLEGTALRIRNAEGRRVAEIAAGAEGLGAVTLFARKDTEPQVRLQAGEQGAVLESLRGERVVWPEK